MEFALSVIGSMAFFAWYLWCSLRYYVALRRSLGRDFNPSLSELLDSYFVEGWHAQFSRQADPLLESMRRRVWLAMALCIGYVLLSHAFWGIVLG